MKTTFVGQWHILLLALIISCHAETPSQKSALPPASLEASVDKAQALTSDRIRFNIRLEHDPQVQADIPDVGDKIEGLQILNQGETPATKQEGRVRKGRWYELRADEAGSYILPAVQMSAQTASGPLELSTAKIFVEVKSRLDGNAEAEGLRDIKPLIKQRLPFSLLVLCAALAAALLAAAVFAFDRYGRKRQKSALPTKAVLPDQWALQQLDELRAAFPAGWDPTNVQMCKRYYFRLSEIYRGYLERRFQFSAVDLTTEEILPLLVKAFTKEDLPQEVLNWGREFLQETDLNKFTDRVPDIAEPERHWQVAKNFVMRTRITPSVTEVRQFKESSRMTPAKAKISERNMTANG